MKTRVESETKSTIPRLILKAGMVAGAAAGVTPPADATLVSDAAQPLCIRVQQTTDLESVVETLRSQIPETWNESKHGPELHKLIVKHAVEGENLPHEDRVRLRTLQAMRRETLPMATSYAEFMRERERLADLQRLTEQLAEYVRKYES